MRDRTSVGNSNFGGVRLAIVTWSPDFAMAKATCRPMKPVPPRTRWGRVRPVTPELNIRCQRPRGAQRIDRNIVERVPEAASREVIRSTFTRRCAFHLIKQSIDTAPFANQPAKSSSEQALGSTNLLGRISGFWHNPPQCECVPVLQLRHLAIPSSPRIPLSADQSACEPRNRCAGEECNKIYCFG